MADIRINSLPTTASASSSDDFLALDGATNGTRKLNAYSPTFGGNLTVSGTGGGTFTGPVTFGSPTNIGSASAVWVGGNGSSGAFFNVPTGANLQFGINNSGLVSITSTATTLQNNLTVSGTGTSSFAGPVTGTSSTNSYQWTLTGSGVGGPFLALDATNATVANRYSGLTLYSGGTFQWGLQLRAGDGKFHIYDGVRGADALTVDVGPSSGVAGTTTVGGNLTVSGSANLTSSSSNNYIYDGTGWVWTSTGTSGGTVKGGIYTAGGELFITANSSLATNRFALTSSGNATVAGNLTVSGGQIALAASASTPSVLITQTDPAQYSVVRLQNTGGTAQSYDFAVGGAGAGSLARKFYIYDGTASATRLAIAPTTGNVLVGTTTDTGEKLQVNGTGYFAGALIQLGNGTVDAIYRVTASNGKSSEFGDDTTGGFVRANNSQSLRFITGGTTALTLDTSQNATFAGNVRAGTVVGTAKTVMIDAAFTTLLNVTKTFTVTMPSPSLASSFVLEVGVYGNTATGYASLMVKGGGYLGTSTLYEATELTKINSGSVTISSVTKANGSMTFTVINTSSSGHVAICYKQTSDDVFTTLPTITAV